jgi:hypothetical protein
MAVALLLQLLTALSGTAVLSAQSAGREGLVPSSAAPAGSALSVALLPVAAAQEPGDAEETPALEFFRQMTALDVLFIFLWIGVIVFGVTSGVIRTLMLIVALLVGAIVGALIAGPLSPMVGVATAQTRSVALPGTYTGAVLLISIVVFVIAISCPGQSWTTSGATSASSSPAPRSCPWSRPVSR